jgi:hypothetical protein
VNVSALIDASVTRFIEVGSGPLSRRERLLVAIWGLEADVNNGGFNQYYFNSYGDFALEVPGYLRAIGADQAATIVETANAAFGPDGPPSDRDLRQDQLESLSEKAAEVWDELDAAFWEYPDDIERLVQAYVESKNAAV